MDGGRLPGNPRVAVQPAPCLSGDRGPFGDCSNWESRLLLRKELIGPKDLAGPLAYKPACWGGTWTAVRAAQSARWVDSQQIEPGAASAVVE